MILDVVAKTQFVHRAVLTLAAREDAVQTWVFVLHVCLEGDGLDAGVAAVLTLVGLAAGVTHAVAPQSVVVSSLIVAHVTSTTRHVLE